MNSRGNTILAVVLVAALVGLFFAAFEFVEERQWVGLRDEARSQPLLAAGRLLRRLGVDASAVRQNAWPGAPDESETAEASALMVWNPPKRLDASRAERLRTWVENGGHLVTTLRTDARENFYFWMYAGELVDAVISSPPEPEAPVEAEKTPTSAALRLAGGDLTDVETVEWTRYWPEVTGLPPLGEAVARTADAGWRLIPEGELVSDNNCEAEFADDGEVVVAYCLVGEGWVTYVDDIGAFLNHRLGGAGRAVALATIFEYQRGEVVLIDLGYGESRALFSWAINRAPLAVLLGVLGIVLLLWSRAPRLGPAFDVAAPQRRAVTEHLTAAGQFGWRHDRGRRLLERLADRVRQRAERRVADWRVLDDPARAAALAAQTNTNPDDIRAALGPAPDRPLRPHELSARVRLLNALWRAL